MEFVRRPGSTDIIVDPSTIKRYAITCRCSTRFVVEVPEELHGIGVKHDCPTCQRAFVVCMGRVAAADTMEELKKKKQQGGIVLSLQTDTIQ